MPSPNNEIINNQTDEYNWIDDYYRYREMIHNTRIALFEEPIEKDNIIISPDWLGNDRIYVRNIMN